MKRNELEKLNTRYFEKREEITQITRNHTQKKQKVTEILKDHGYLLLTFFFDYHVD